MPNHVDKGPGRKNNIAPYQDGKEPEAPKISAYHHMLKLGDYNFNVNTSELVAVLKDIENKERWIKEIRTDPSKHSQKFWCKFRNNHGNKTTDCRVLQNKIDCLLKQVYFTELFSEKGK